MSDLKSTVALRVLVRKLRGDYPVGPLNAAGEPEFGWRDLSGEITTRIPTALMLEAADALEGLIAANDVLQTQDTEEKCDG